MRHLAKAMRHPQALLNLKLRHISASSGDAPDRRGAALLNDVKWLMAEWRSYTACTPRHCEQAYNGEAAPSYAQRTGMDILPFYRSARIM